MGRGEGARGGWWLVIGRGAVGHVWAQGLRSPGCVFWGGGGGEFWGFFVRFVGADRVAMIWDSFGSDKLAS